MKTWWEMEVPCQKNLDCISQCKRVNKERKRLPTKEWNRLKKVKKGECYSSKMCFYSFRSGSHSKIWNSLAVWHFTLFLEIHTVETFSLKKTKRVWIFGAHADFLEIFMSANKDFSEKKIWKVRAKFDQSLEIWSKRGHFFLE